MKEMKDLHLKADAVMGLFEQIVSSIPHEHFGNFKDQIMEKSADQNAFADLNDDLCTELVEACIVFLYGDLVTKLKLTALFEILIGYIDEEVRLMIEEDATTERALNYQRIFLKHYNAMHIYNEILINNLADKIKINIK
jgi:hypothetical protein